MHKAGVYAHEAKEHLKGTTNMRSWLFVPGDSEQKIAKALTSRADVIILDLEDSVARQNKASAREIVSNFLASRPKTSALIYVRINALDTSAINLDLQATAKTPPDGYMLPKSNHGQDVENFAKLASPNTPIIAITTETASSMFNLGTYSNLAAPLTAMTWGAEDLSAELGATQVRNDVGELTDPYRLAQTLCLVGARAAGVEPIDSIFANFRDMDGLKRECQQAARDGFTGKMAIHPGQIDLINETFTPSPSAIEKAEMIVAAFAHDTSAGVIAIEGQMFDLPHLKRAEKLLNRAKRP